MPLNPNPKPTLKKKLDEIFSRYIRLRATDQYGYGQCFTCEHTYHWKQVDAGHFVTRAKTSTRWHEHNVQFQCKRCNMNGGEQYKFSIKLNQTYGPDTAENLYIASNKLAKISPVEMESMIAHYRKLVNDLIRQKRLG